jgi:membrane fusion protein (multidrug efflux system)
VTELLGKYFVSVVDSANKIEQIAITPGTRIGDLWVVKSGLAGGERVVTDGLQTVKPGMLVKPMTPETLSGPATPSQQP